MSDLSPNDAVEVRAENATMVRKLVVVALLMFGFGWALILLSVVVVFFVGVVVRHWLYGG